MKRNILITGSHRSGSTWVGEMLAQAPGTGYIHEPFNIDYTPDGVVKPFPNWFQYIDDNNADDYVSYLHDVIEFKYKVGRVLAASRSSRTAAWAVREGARTTAHRVRRDRAIVKDPIAIFAAEWMATEFDMDVLVTMRHPAAFCSSLKLKGWEFDFNNFLQQPKLMKETLGSFENEIKRHVAGRQDIISQGILLWNCIAYLTSTYRDAHRDWLFMKHEDVSADPVLHFRAIYAFFNLNYTPRVHRAIINSSGEHNPPEQTQGSENLRDSRKNIRNWEKRLTAPEIDRIRTCTKDLFSEFYAESDW